MITSTNSLIMLQVETIPDLEKQAYDTQQRYENVEALLDIVSAKVFSHAPVTRYIVLVFGIM